MKPELPETSKVKVDKKITVQAARQAIIQERQQRAMECSKELNALLKKFNCDLIAVPHINNEGKIVAQAQIVAKE